MAMAAPSRGPTTNRRWRGGGRSGPRRVLALVPAALAVLLRLPYLRGPQFDYDEGVYWESLRSMAAGHRLFTEVYSSQPPGFLLLLAPFQVAGSGELTVLRLGMMAFAVIGVVAAQRLAEPLAGFRSALLAGALLAADPLFLRQTVAIQADGPAIALSVVAAALVVQAAGGAARWRLLTLTGGAALGLGIMIKLLAVAAVLPVLFVLLRPGVPDRRSGLALLGLGAAGAMTLVMLPFAADLGPAWNQIVVLHLTGRTIDSGGLGGSIPKALLAESPLIAAALAATACRRSRLRWPAVAWMAGAAAVFAVQRPLWHHHLVALSPGLALAGAPALVAWARRAAYLLPLLPAAAGLTYLAMTAAPQGSPEAIAPRLAALLPAGGYVLTDDQFALALAGRDAPPELVDTSGLRIRSGELDLRTIRSVVARRRVVAVLLGRGQLREVEGFDAWVAEAYPRRMDLGSGRILLLPDTPPPPAP